MQQSNTLAANTSPAVSAKSSPLVQIIGTLIIGAAMLFGVGFASMDVAHNAAHDTRHAVAFPCH